MKTGHLKQDESGHWYLVPSDKIRRFTYLLEGIEQADTPETMDEYADAFIDEFNEYRLSGGIEDYEVTINE